MSNNSTNFIFALLGLLLGVVVGFMVTAKFNENQVQSQKEKPGAVQGSEKLPEGHPNVDIEKEVSAAVEFGKQNPDYESQLRVGSFLYAEAQRYEQAKPFFLKAHELKPEEIEPLILLGNLTFDMSQNNNDPKLKAEAEEWHGKAKTSLLKAHQLKPEEAQPMVQLGNFIFDLSEKTNNPKLMVEAGEWYEKALKIKPDNINVRTDLGATYYLREPPDYKSALGQYEKALAIEPKHTRTLYNKTLALIGLKDLKAAEETFTLLKEVNPQPESEGMKDLQAQLDKAKVAGGSEKIPTH